MTLALQVGVSRVVIATPLVKPVVVALLVKVHTDCHAIRFTDLSAMHGC